jgi:ATP-dependent DNA ligase
MLLASCAGEPYFFAFDLLWQGGEDFRRLPLIERKVHLRSVVPQRSSHLLYCDHVKERGEELQTGLWARCRRNCR